MMNPAFSVRLIIALVLIVILLSGTRFCFAQIAESSDTGAIQMYDIAICEGTSVKLIDVADLTGKAAVLSQLVIAPFPASSQRMTITIEQIRKTLDDANSNQGRITVRGYAQCIVQRSTAEAMPVETKPVIVTKPVAMNVTAEKPISENVKSEKTVNGLSSLREQVSVLLEKHAGVTRPDLRITFSPVDAKTLDQDVTGMRLEFEPIAAAPVGRVPVVIRGYRENKPVETWRVTADLAKKAIIVTAVRPLVRGQTITAADVMLRVQDVYLSDFRGQPVDDLTKVLGKTAQTTIRPGQTICADQIRSAILVKRNEPVLVRCIAGGMVVSINGKALEDGALNQVIQITNESNRTTLTAKVTASGEAMVQLSDTNNTAAPANEKGAP